MSMAVLQPDSLPDAATIGAPALNGKQSASTSAKRGGQPTTIVEEVPEPSWWRAWLGDFGTGLILAIPLAPLVATILTVIVYISPANPGSWRDVVAGVPVPVMFAGNLVI